MQFPSPIRGEGQGIESADPIRDRISTYNDKPEHYTNIYRVVENGEERLTNSIPHSFCPAPDADHTWTKGGVPTDYAGTIIYNTIEEVQGDRRSGFRNRPVATDMKDWTHPRDVDPADVEDWARLNAPGKNYYARELERWAVDAETEDDPEEAARLRRKAETVYWSLIDSDFVGTFPYKRLCILYRGRLSDPEKEKDNAQRALDEAAVSTNKQKEWFENRIERADELRAKNS